MESRIGSIATIPKPVERDFSRCVNYLTFFFFFSSRRRHTRFDCDWSSDVCSSDLLTMSILCARSKRTRVIGFGLLWFLIALLPTSLFPLAEVMNDHRTFLPYIGLVDRKSVV